MTFQEKLNEKLFDQHTLKTIIKLIFDKAMEDREKAKELFNKIMKDYGPDGSASEKEAGKDGRPEVNIMFPVTTYMKLMKESNVQLIELVKIIEKLVNAGVKAASGTDSSEKEDELIPPYLKAVLSEQK